MIDISNATADEILLVINELRNMSKDIPGVRASNIRRRGKRLENYINKKINEKKEIETH